MITRDRKYNKRYCTNLTLLKGNPLQVMAAAKKSENLGAEEVFLKMEPEPDCSHLNLARLVLLYPIISILHIFRYLDSTGADPGIKSRDIFILNSTRESIEESLEEMGGNMKDREKKMIKIQLRLMFDKTTEEQNKKKVFGILSFGWRLEITKKGDHMFIHAIFLFDTGDLLDVLAMVGKETVEAEWLTKETPTPAWSKKAFIETKLEGAVKRGKRVVEKGQFSSVFWPLCCSNHGNGDRWVLFKIHKSYLKILFVQVLLEPQCGEFHQQRDMLELQPGGGGAKEEPVCWLPEG